MQEITERQLRLARLIADGLTYKEMGEALNTNPRTVKAETDVLRRRLGLKEKRSIPRMLRKLGVDF